MKLGINIPNFGPGTTPSSLAGWARFAEDAGFDAALMSDHVALTPEVAEQYPAPFYDPFTTLGWLAGITEKIELGTTVTLLPYRNPLLVARVAANIDQFSGGRFILGVAAGWSAQEFAALGVPFRRRGAISDDHLSAIRKLWSTDVATHRGEFVTFDDVHTGPRPVRRPHPPIWVGGTSRGALGRAVQHGDAWHPNNAELGWLRSTGLPALREAAEVAGRPVPALCPRMRLHLTDTKVDEGTRRIGEGDLAQVSGDLQELEKLGAGYVVLDTNPDHPAQRQPDAVGQRALESVATAYRS